MFWVFKKYIFPFFAMVWMTTLKQIAGKARQNNRNFLYPKVVIESILKNKFQAILKSKMNGKSKMAFSTFLLIFKWPSWDLFFQKARQNNQNCINPKLIIGSVFKNGFEPTMRPKTNVNSLADWHFHLFERFWVAPLKLLSGKVTMI